MAKYQKKTKEERDLQMGEILKKLEDGTRAVFYSENYKNWLNMFSKFYRYSFNNTLLIYMQRPDAELVNSFARWKTLGRNVNKGASGIKILCPIKYEYDAEQEVYQDGSPVLNADGTNKTEQVKRQGLRFKVGYVFDVSDTNGADLPTLTKEIKESPEVLEQVIQQIIDASDIPIAIDNSLSEKDAYGYYHLTENRIGLRANLSTGHTIKTICHEYAHYKLHQIGKEKVPKEVREIEAESTAYVVLSYFGFGDMLSEYSFPYVASYSERDLKDLQNSLSRIEQTSREMIDWLLENTDLTE